MGAAASTTMPMIGSVKPVKPGSMRRLGECVEKSGTAADYVGPIVDGDQVPTYYKRIVGQRVRFERPPGPPTVKSFQLGERRCNVSLELDGDIDADQTFPNGTGGSVQYVLDDQRSFWSTGSAASKGRLGLSSSIPEGITLGLKAMHSRHTESKNTSGAGSLSLTLRIPTVNLFYARDVTPHSDSKPFVSEAVVGIQAKVHMNVMLAESQSRKGVHANAHAGFNADLKNSDLSCAVGGAVGHDEETRKGPVVANVRFEGDLQLKGSEMNGMSLEDAVAYIESKAQDMVGIPEKWQVLHVVVDERAVKAPVASPPAVVNRHDACVTKCITALQAQLDATACNLPKHQRVLVYGEVGVGKSLLIKECTGEDVKSGRKRSGITKHVREYIFEDSCGSIGLVDCPGVGDHDISVPQVLDEVASLFPEGSFSAIVFVANASHPRFTIGQEYISKVLNVAFKNNVAWSENIIFLATHWDKVDEDEREETETEMRGIAKGIAEDAEGSESAAIPSDQIIMKQKGDTSDFKACLRKIIDRRLLQFRLPTHEQWLGIFCEVVYPNKSVEDVQKLFVDEIQKPRRQDALGRLAKARDSGSLEELSRQLLSAKVIFGEDDCSELRPFEEKHKDLSELCSNFCVKLNNMITSQDFTQLGDVSIEIQHPPYNDHDEIKRLLLTVQNMNQQRLQQDSAQGPKQSKGARGQVAQRKSQQSRSASESTPTLLQAGEPTSLKELEGFSNTL